MSELNNPPMPISNDPGMLGVSLRAVVVLLQQVFFPRSGSGLVARVAALEARLAELERRP